MWCKNCRQDVPAVNGANSDQSCCIRCGAVLAESGKALLSHPSARSPQSLRGPNLRALSSEAAAKNAAKAVSSSIAAGSDFAVLPSPAPSTVSLRAPLSAFDTWELEEQLRHVDRILSGARFTAEYQHPAAAEQPPAPSTPMKTKLARLIEARQQPRRARRRVRIAWAVAAIGAAALVAGMLLLGVGAVAGFSTCQRLGLPITLLGQVALLLGMMMQLDLVWHGKRETASKLYSFQKRLGDLEALAAELSTAAGDPSQPDRDERELMTELKTRLDLLSHRLNVPCG